MLKQRLPAPAKINLHLSVLGINAQGYHLLDTSFAFVDLCDWIDVQLADGLTVTCSDSRLSGESNLVFQVLQALRMKHQVKKGLEVHIEKHIPMQAGLGGGSSDAATALLAANHFWGLRLSRQSLMDFAISFGADIPCFLFGYPSWASGLGEKLIKRKETFEKQRVLLTWPRVGLSTKDVFNHLDQSQDLTTENCLAKMRAPESNTLNLGCNDLQDVACSLCPELDEMLRCMRQHCKQSWMSGSGSACVALLNMREKEELLMAELRNQNNIWCHQATILKVHPLINQSYWDVAKR